MEILRVVKLCLWWVLTGCTFGSLVEEQLQEHLFKDYNKYIRPSEKLADVVEVDIYLTLLQLISVDEKSEEMTTSQYIALRWYDQRLTWNPSNFSGIEGIRVPSQIVWRPDLALSNNIDGHYDTAVPVNALLNYTGVVEWLPPSIYKSSCSIQVEYFPFDWQNCTLRFRTFTYSAKEVWLHSVYNKAVVDKEAYTDNGEWKVIHCPIRVNQDPRDGEYQDITLYFIIQRKPLFYVINIIIPCVLISSLSVLVFYLPSGCSEKTNMSISVLLGLPVYLLLLAKRVPETSLGVPLIGAYLLFTMLSVTFSVIFSVIVLNIYHRSPITHEMKPWARMIFIEFLPPLLHMDSTLPTPPCCETKEGGEKMAEEIELDEINEKSNEDAEKQLNGSVGVPLRKIVTSALHKASLPQKIPLLGDIGFARNKTGSRDRPKDSADIATMRDEIIYREVNRKLRAKGKRNSVGAVDPMYRGVYSPITEKERRRVYHPIADRFEVLAPESAKCDAAASLAISQCELQPILSLPRRGDENVIFDGEVVDAVNAAVSTDVPGHQEYFRLTCNERRSVYKAIKSQRSRTSDESPNRDAYFDIEHPSLPVSSKKTPGKVVARTSTKSSTTVQCTPNFPSTSDDVTTATADHLHKTDDISVENKVFGDSEPNSSHSTADCCRFRKGNKASKSPPRRYVVHELPEKANECLNAVTSICDHMRSENEHKAKVQEWQMVAMVLDRLMFWIFLLVYITGSLYFAIQALTNFPPDHPFLAGDPKYAGCWDDHLHKRGSRPSGLF